MIVDSSALVGIVHDEEDAKRLLDRLLGASDPKRMSAANYLETCIVVDSAKKLSSSRLLDQIIESTPIEICPVTADQARIARQAYRDFGKGSGHPAQLNFGDCFAYALAFSTNEPLLCKGDDFRHTGIDLAI